MLRTIIRRFDDGKLLGIGDHSHGAQRWPWIVEVVSEHYDCWPDDIEEQCDGELITVHGELAAFIEKHPI